MIKILRFYNVFGVLASENYLVLSGGFYFLYNKHNVFHRSRVFSNFFLLPKTEKMTGLIMFFEGPGASGGHPADVRRPSDGALSRSRKLRKRQVL
jgi:hypothetical protein